MSIAVYTIVRKNSLWSLENGGSAEGEWETKEAAYEAAIAAGSNAIKQGLGVRIEVPEPRNDEAALG